MANTAWIRLIGMVLALVISYPAQGAPGIDAEVRQGSGIAAAQEYRGEFASLGLNIDAYWADVFSQAGAPYISPKLAELDQQARIVCGEMMPVEQNLYCRRELTIYVAPTFLRDQLTQFGDLSPHMILAHDWAHHVQHLTGIQPGSSVSLELQADCLAGAYARQAVDAGFFTDSEFLKFLLTAVPESGGSGLHTHAGEMRGSSTKRVEETLSGFEDGPIVGCGLPLVAISRNDASAASSSDSPIPASPSAQSTPIVEQAQRDPGMTTAETADSQVATPATETPFSEATSTPEPLAGALDDRATPKVVTIPELDGSVDAATPAVTIEAADKIPQPASFYIPDALGPAAPACAESSTDVHSGLEEILGRFSDVAAAAERLTSLGWQEGAVREFNCMLATPDSPTWASISVNIFETAAGARDSLPFFAEQRMANTRLTPVTAVKIGESNLSIAGPSEDGVEYTLYTSLGRVALRVSAVAATDSPAPVVEAISRELLSVVSNAPNGTEADRPASLAEFVLQPPPVANPDCFTLTAAYPLSLIGIAEDFDDPEAMLELLRDWGWEEGWFVRFECSRPTLGGSDMVEMLVHRFESPDAAQEAAMQFSQNLLDESEGLTLVPGDQFGDFSISVSGRSYSGQEYRIYATNGEILFRTAAYGPENAPGADAQATMDQLLRAAEGSSTGR